jgi:hypothetical protein
MKCNPFLDTSSVNMPLQRDINQRIHYSALRAAMRGLQPDELPDGISSTQSRQRVRLGGPSVYIAHPLEIDRIFTGVTLAVYQTVETLYCDRLGRSVQMVSRILNAMADQARVPQIAHEAVWAICTYLNERREDSSDVTIERTEDIWRIAQISPSVYLRDGAAEYRPLITCVLNMSNPKVLAFRIADNGETNGDISLAIYDAIVSQRYPASEGAAGLAWKLPSKLTTEVDLMQDCQDTCERVGIPIEQANGPVPHLLKSLRGSWTRDLSGKPLRKDRFTVLFDNYLEKVCGYGPLREQERQEWKFIQRVGYNREPAWQFPALRQFLPAHPGTVTDDGAVAYDGLHYKNELLTYWPEHKVVLRRSESSEAVAWIYLDDQFLCQAMARELRRRDGSYRLNRPRR